MDLKEINKLWGQCADFISNNRDILQNMIALSIASDKKRMGKDKDNFVIDNEIKCLYKLQEELNNIITEFRKDEEINIEDVPF